MMSQETPQPPPENDETPQPFPHSSAPQILPLEAAKIRSLDSSPGLPRWQPEEGEFN